MSCGIKKRLEVLLLIREFSLYNCKMGYLFPKILLKKWMTKTGEWLTHIDVENSH